MRPAAAPSPIGLDLGSRVIRAAQLDRAGRVLARASLLRREPGAAYSVDEFRRLRGVLYRAGFRGRDLAVVAPKSIIQRTSLDLPPRSSNAPLDEIARSELARQGRLDPGAFEFCWWEAPQPPRHTSGTRALTTMCPVAASNELLAMPESLGMHPIVLFSPGTAAGLAGAAQASAGRRVAMLDLGWSDATLVALGATGIYFERQLSGCGLGDAMTAAAKRRGVPVAALAEAFDTPGGPVSADWCDAYRDRVADEMRSSIEYLRGCDGSHEPEEILLLGGGAGTPGLAQAVEASTETPTRPETGSGDPAGAAAFAAASFARVARVEEAA